MPRTIESIVENHRVANARHRAGKPIWDCRLPIREIMRQAEEREGGADALTPAEAYEIAKEIAAVLKAHIPASWRDPEDPHFTMDGEEVFERWEQALESDFTPSKEFPEEPVDVLNGWLDELYDWADRLRVWVC